ncbi:MAG: bifunctional 2-C-methyl-D-erythritol 4-phosphate cytidylyltransferase/2-C-methyl-D-erythritol 2,4-cyclodiphosphate synthase, partial [Microbacteriaceae bacterium]|nr:bifunctional 2-C-methyl-D-erythritol 4-phosphate cytidylyltransferase/2-C-methyl-D-erythritol 2,4-cyclodiphosphate synthase [Microbacteriaceae bacterium]
ASHEDRVAEFSGIATAFVGNRVPLTFTPGGLSRQGSIGNALAAVNKDIDIVLVHDVARCFAPAAVFNRVIAMVSETGFGVVPVLPVADTIKQGERDIVLGTIDRDSLRVAQTPQGFRLAELKAAYENAVEDFTDDASLMQSTGAVVRSVQGDTKAFKITVPADLEYAEFLLNGSSEFRSGIGTDVHRFATTPTPLYLGTILWPGCNC